MHIGPSLPLFQLPFISFCFQDAAPKIHSLLLPETLVGKPELRQPAIVSVSGYGTEPKGYRFWSANGGGLRSPNNWNRNSAGEGAASDSAGELCRKREQEWLLVVLEHHA